VFRRQPEFHVTVDGEVVAIEGHRLEQLIEELQRLTDGRAEVLSVDRYIVGGIAGFFGREYFRIEARSADAQMRAVDAGAPGAGEPPAGSSDDSLDAQSFAAALAAALEEQAAPTSTSPTDEETTEPPPPSAPVVEAPPAPEHQEPPAEEAPAPSTAHTWSATTGSERTSERPPETEEQDGLFVHLALPELNLSDLLGRLDPLVQRPVLPPEHGIVAIVGDPVHAARTAEQLCAPHGGDTEQSVVLLVRDSRRDRHEEWPVLTDLADAIAQRRRWRNRPAPTFVAIALDLSEEGIRWVRNALIALDPVQVRYAAPAWRSPEEHGERIDAIACVDAVDLVHLDASVEPSTFLGLSPPVSTLDGRPVSPGLWAAYLLAAPTPLRATSHDLAGSCP
jgi:hypothetical protein